MTVYPTPRSKPPTIHDAIAIAAAAHHGHVDKSGRPYIFHPLAVAERFPDEDTQIVAVLHDIVEDTELGLGDLRNFGFTAEVVDAVDRLTRRDGEDYETYLTRVAGTDLSATVKFADIAHNTDSDRLRRLSDPERNRLIAKYEDARIRLARLLGERWRATPESRARKILADAYAEADDGPPDWAYDD